MIDMAEQFEAEGAFANDGAARSLKVHLKAVERFEQRAEADKVEKHINSFKLLLDHHLGNELISEDAYEALYGKAESMIGQWG
ncbi:FIMAH domain-containing protein [Lentibacillus sediminis]|uniref:FIMAH domain-containing protein n=1 Tax=Lentibacillus sediminis TaxID=1940529 RepID=UPI003B84B177